MKFDPHNQDNGTNEEQTSHYENNPITHRGDLMNLTQMWVATDRPKNRQPHEWLRLPSTERFLQRLESVTGLSRNAPLVADRGGKPGAEGSTWAHWQLALVYAHYLDPDFYIWCNEVVHSAMPYLKGLPAGPAQSMASYFEDAFGHLERRLDVIKQYAADNLILTAAVQHAPGKRLKFTQRTRRIICATIADEPFGDNCPCCTQRPVLSSAGTPLDGAEFDHFYGPALNRPEYGWLICAQCHKDIGSSPLLRISLIPVFHTFQGHVLDYLLTQKGVMARLDPPLEEETVS